MYASSAEIYGNVLNCGCGRQTATAYLEDEDPEEPELSELIEEAILLRMPDDCSEEAMEEDSELDMPSLLCRADWTMELRALELRELEPLLLDEEDEPLEDCRD